MPPLDSIERIAAGSPAGGPADRVDDLEPISIFGREPAWVGEHYSDKPGARTGLLLASDIYRRVTTAVGIFLDGSAKARLNDSLSTKGQRDMVTDLATSVRRDLNRQRGPLGQLRGDRDKILAEFKPVLPYEGAELAVREAEVRSLLPMDDPTLLGELYAEAIERGDGLVIAAIENAPRVPVSLPADASDLTTRADGGRLTGLPAEKLTEGRRGRINAEDPIAARKLADLEAATDDIERALVAATNYVEKEAGLRPELDDGEDEDDRTAA